MSSIFGYILFDESIIFFQKQPQGHSPFGSRGSFNVGCKKSDKIKLIISIYGNRNYIFSKFI